MGEVYPKKASFALFAITTSLTATSCNPPKDSVTMGTKMTPSRWQASADFCNLHLAFKGIFNVCKSISFRLKSALKCYGRENDFNIYTPQRILLPKAATHTNFSTLPAPPCPEKNLVLPLPVSIEKSCLGRSGVKCL